MHEPEFWAAYRASQERITVSDETKQALIENMKCARCEKDEQENSATDGGLPTTWNEAKTSTGNVKPSPTSRKQRSVARILVPLAACFILVALMVGVFGGVGTGPKAGTAVTPDFSVQAYAAETNSLLTIGSDNKIIFDRAPDTYSVPTKEDYLSTEGVYTGSIFRIEGAGIARIQASVSTGALYSYDYDSFTRASEPEKWYEMIHWKPLRRGMGDHFGAYDDVQPLGQMNPELPKDSPDYPVTVALSKKLGSTIDVQVTDDLSTYSFGFWTNECIPGTDDTPNSISQAVDLFEGAQLTITATFEDGHTTTQLIELHAANVKATQTTTDNGSAALQLTPEIVNEVSGTEGVDYVHTLYGKVIETTDSAFPGSLDNANEFADTVGAAATIGGRPPVEPMLNTSGAVAAIEDSGVHASTDSLDIMSTENRTYALSNFSVLERNKSIPAGLTLDDIWNGLTDTVGDVNDWAYFNQIVAQVDGYQLDENGVPSEGYSWVMLQGDITNIGTESTEQTCDGGFYGTISIADSEGTLSRVLTRTFTITNGSGWDASKSAQYFDITMDPGETQTVRWLAVVPDFVLDDPNLLFVVEYGDKPQAFSMTMPQ